MTRNCPLPRGGLDEARKAGGRSAHSTRLARLGCVTFALLSLLSLASLAQAQTNRPSGTVVAWGAVGEVPVEAQSGVVAIAAGIEHTVALKSDGSVMAWGGNQNGETTVPVAAQSGVVAIAAGYGHSVALKTNGSVVAWGGNWAGQTTVPVAAQSGVVAIAAGNGVTLALKTNGSVIAWGSNLQTGTVPVAAQSGVVAIAAANWHNVALKNDGSVVAWGNNLFGQTTVPVAAKSGVVAIAAGWTHTVALKSDGSVVAWGSNTHGQLDVPAAAQSGVVAIAAGGGYRLTPRGNFLGGHTLALKSDGSVVAWGWNDDGQTEVPVAAQSAVVAITAGERDSLAIVRHPAPSLSILRNADQTVSLSWIGAGALEQTESQTAPNWQPAPSQSNPQTLSTTGAMRRFYRLRYNQ